MNNCTDTENFLAAEADLRIKRDNAIHKAEKEFLDSVGRLGNNAHLSLRALDARYDPLFSDEVDHQKKMVSLLNSTCSSFMSASRAFNDARDKAEENYRKGVCYQEGILEEKLKPGFMGDGFPYKPFRKLTQDQISGPTLSLEENVDIEMEMIYGNVPYLLSIAQEALVDSTTRSADAQQLCKNLKQRNFEKIGFWFFKIVDDRVAAIAEERVDDMLYSDDLED